MPFLFACNNNEEDDPKVDTEVTKEEFDNAVINKDETHCQTTFKQIKYTNEQTMTIDAQCSPGKSYIDMTSSEQGNMRAYAYALDDGINCMMTQKLNDSGWTEESKEKIADLIEANIYVTNESYSVKRMLLYVAYINEINFSDFKYENEVYTHEYIEEDTDYTKYTYVTIHFANKKVDNYSISIETEAKQTNEKVKVVDGKFTCAYEKVDVVDPRV